MNKKYILFLISLLIVSYSSFAQNVTIKGELQNNKFSEVYLMSAYKNAGTPLAHADIDAKGSFSLSLPIDSTDMYMLKFSEKQSFLLCLSPKEKISLTLDANNLQRVVSVSGSESIAFTKELTDLLARRTACLDSINRELQNNKAQQYLVDYATGFKAFHQSFVDVQPDIVSALQKCDSMNNLLDVCAKKGKVGKKYLDYFLNAAVANLKLLKNYYASYVNYWNALDTRPYEKRMEDAQYKSFDDNVSSYLKQLNDFHKIVSFNLSDYAKEAEVLIAQYEEALYDGKLENAKLKSTYADSFAKLINKNKSASKNAEEIHSQSDLITRLGNSIVVEAQDKVQGIVARYQNEFNTKDALILNRLSQLMLDHKTDLATLMFLDNFSTDKKVVGEVLTALHQKYPTHSLVVENYNKINSPQFRTSAGQIAPELEFANPEGKILKLSDLRGKVVLIDFWASWCGPCRRENPNVVNLYAKYNSKGFEVFSVSLDNNKAKWVEAIQKDNLSWPNHVSDLKGWSSAAAKLYGVNSIPCTFLIDKDGRIIAKGLRGDELGQKLKQIFGE